MKEVKNEDKNDREKSSRRKSKGRTKKNEIMVEREKVFDHG